MSSLGLGSSKKGSRVADSSMMTRNIRQTANSSSVKNETLTLGNLGIPSFRVPAVQTIQTIYKGLTPADMNSLNSASLVAKYIRNYAPEPLYASSYAIPDFTIPNVTYVSGDGTSPYVVTYLGQTYTAVGTDIYSTRPPQCVFLRTTTTPDTGVPQWNTVAGYDGVTGIATGVTTTTVGETTVDGEYLQITAPTAFILTSYTLLPGFHGSIPDNWIVAGSNDGGDTFTLVDTQTQTDQWILFVDQEHDNVYISLSFSLPLNTASYTTYRIIFTRVSPGTGSVGITTWNLFKNIQIN